VIILAKDWFKVIVEIIGESSDYESAGHGVKSRILDAGFKEENIKITNIKKLKPDEIPSANDDESTVPDINEILDLMEDNKDDW
jgi:hypothetical protein